MAEGVVEEVLNSDGSGVECVGGLVLDNVVLFLYGILATAMSSYRSRNWATTDGVLEAALAPKSEMYPYATLRYAYTVMGKSYKGIYKKSFWSSRSAEDFASLYPHREKLIIRYRPDAPARSCLRMADQPTNFSGRW